MSAPLPSAPTPRAPAGLPGLGRDWWWDVVPALPLLLVGLVGTGRAADNQQAATPDVAAFVLVAVAALALLARRVRPLTTLAVVGVATTAYLVAGYPYGPLLLMAPVAVHAVVTRTPWPRSAALAGALYLVTGAAEAVHLVRDGSGQRSSLLEYLTWAVAWAAVLTAPAAIGAAVRVRRRAEAGVRVEQARRAVADERLAMARDVHDGVGHGLAVIAMHSGVALLVLEQDPVRARELLTTIQATSRESLDGLRADLDRLRTGSAADSPTRPSPGLDELPALLTRMRGGGLVVHEHVRPDDDLPPAVTAAAYRIVQESLTNVLRHSGGATTAWVHVGRTADVLTVEVRDNGTASGTADLVGSGIPGMRSRAEALGGTLVAGPATDGGFRVRASLPAHVPAASEATT